MIEQIPFNESFLTFADNPDPRCPCILLIDTSGSMNGEPIKELNKGLKNYVAELQSDTLASRRVEVALISFGESVKIIQEFGCADSFSPPDLKASGLTPMGSAICQAIELLNIRKKIYKENGIQYYRPWIFMITDGEPTDEWLSAKKLIQEGEHKKSFSFFAVGVKGANKEILKQISVRDPVMLDSLKFTELFVWLSASQKSVSQSKPGDEVGLPSPSGWAFI